MTANLEKQVVNNTEKSRDVPFYGWLIVVLGMLVCIVAYGFFYAFGVFFQDIQAAFQGDRASIALIASIMTVSMSVSTFLWGWLSDKYGPRMNLTIAGLLFAAGLFLTTRATSLTQVYIFLGIITALGMGAYCIFIMTVTRWFMKRQGLALGLIAAGIGLGMIITVPIISRLLPAIGWRSTFIICAIAGAVVFGLSAFLIRKSPEDKGLLPYGATTQGVKGMQEAYAKIAASSKTLGQAMRTRELWLVTGMLLFAMLPVFMLSVHLVNYAVDEGMVHTTAALLMTIIGVGSLVGKIGLGGLVDEIGWKKVLISCALLEAAMFLWLSADLSLWMFWAITAIHGVAYGGLFAIYPVILKEHFGVAHYGKIFGVTSIGPLIGGFSGPLIAGNIFESTGSYSAAFLIAAGSAFIATILLVLTRTAQSKAKSQVEAAKTAT